MADVFLSYARNDKPAVQRLAGELESAGLTVWWDHNLAGGARYLKATEAELKASKAVLVCWSRISVESHWVADEAAIGRDEQRLVPISLDGATPPLGFRQFQVIDFARWGHGDEEALPKLLAALAAYVDRPLTRPKKATDWRGGVAAGLRKHWVAVVAGLAAVVAIFAGAALIGPGSNPALPHPDGTVEVMRFAAPASDTQLAQVASSVSDGMMQRLSRGGVRTSAQTSAPGSSSPGMEFGVIGQVSRTGDGELAVDVQVVDQRSGAALWSQRFQRATKESDELVEQVNRSVAAGLQCALEDLKLAKKPLPLTATGLYVNTCVSIFDGSPPERILAITRRLAAAAPDFASAHAMHAIAVGIATWRGSGPWMRLHADGLVGVSITGQNARLGAEGLAAAERAVRLDPVTPKAYLGRGMNRTFKEFALRERDYRRALEIDPDLPPALVFLATVLMDVGQIQNALDLVQRTSAANDLRYAGDLAPMGAVLYGATGALAEEGKEVARLSLMSPEEARATKQIVAFWWGDPAKAIAALRDLPAEDNRKPCLLDYLRTLPALRAGRTQDLPRSCDRIEAAYRIRMYARAGDTDRAYAELAKAPLDRLGPAILYYPEMAGVRADARFAELAQRWGLLEYWRNTSHWPDFCRAPNAPPVCAPAARP